MCSISATTTSPGGPGWQPPAGTFVTRLKTNTPLREAQSRPVAPGGVVLSDQVGLLPVRLCFSRRNPFSQTGRAVTIRIDTGKVLRLFTNDLEQPGRGDCRSLQGALADRAVL